ncbi:MAG: hypothetical protein HY824_15505 [Acidobacteria bacterium]|nr:hypothetical protein [Acidobacteriota bacterium]
MSRRLPALLVFVLALAPSLAAAQSQRWTPPRTPDGQPDLQGFWTNNTYTPLERPKNVTQEFFTKEQAADVVRRAAAEESAQTEPGTVADVHYDFTQFGLDRNQSPAASTLRTSLVVDPADGRLPPLSAEGQRRAAARAEALKGVGRWDSVQTNELDDRCMIFAGAGPPMLPQTYNSNYQIVQAPGYVMILFEMAHDFRVVPLDGRPHVPPEIRQWIGDSRGRWDGDTLVVETTNFNGRNPLRGSSEHMRVVERFTRVNADTIRYQFTIDDQATWTRPWSAELLMRKTIGPLFEHACHEGNYGLYNTLVGARLEDKKAAEAAAARGAK